MMKLDSVSFENSARVSNASKEPQEEWTLGGIPVWGLGSIIVFGLVFIVFVGLLLIYLICFRGAAKTEPAAAGFETETFQGQWERVVRSVGRSKWKRRRSELRQQIRLSVRRNNSQFQLLRNETSSLSVRMSLDAFIQPMEELPHGHIGQRRPSPSGTCHRHSSCLGMTATTAGWDTTQVFADAQDALSHEMRTEGNVPELTSEEPSVWVSISSEVSLPPTSPSIRSIHRRTTEARMDLQMQRQLWNLQLVEPFLCPPCTNCPDGK
ncbi:unnamed protein product [Cyprideis torosa]|uniref:Uncharacterized protein n=1 Tax=Cyprideis torosa TaxID=163714 RepID=A0A7R8W7A2_9CRUS|nr:unnamed protein product [Cyprideis torosa]CAG0883027.1 unnamed protein product [Cyprideis torosa]